MFTRYAKNSLQMQTSKFRLIPYYNEDSPISDDYSDMMYSTTVIAWLWFQFRWYNVW